MGLSTLFQIMDHVPTLGIYTTEVTSIVFLAPSSPRYSSTSPPKPSSLPAYPGRPGTGQNHGYEWIPCVSAVNIGVLTPNFNSGKYSLLSKTDKEYMVGIYFLPECLDNIFPIFQFSHVTLFSFFLRLISIREGSLRNRCLFVFSTAIFFNYIIY